MRFSNVLMVLGVASIGAIGFGCSSSSSSSNTTGGGNNGGGAACAVTAAGCKTDISDCVSLVDNKDQKTFGLRISQLTVTKPSALATGVISTVVNNAVALNYSACTIGTSSDSIYGSGTGTFSWLIQFDSAAGTIKTGGAKPVADPTAGYCFVNDKTAGIAPFSIDAKVGADGKFSMADGKDLTVPIYLDAAAKNVVLLPLHKARLFDGTLSADQNCIGKYNADGLDPDNSCKPDPDNKIYTFTTGASLEGYITLEEADKVEIEALQHESLCVLLSGQDDGATPKRCPRGADKKISVKGDFCSTSNSAGGCADSYQLGATFAASGAKITGDCQ
jgi:hypothetical protein